MEIETIKHLISSEEPPHEPHLPVPRRERHAARAGLSKNSIGAHEGVGVSSQHNVTKLSRHDHVGEVGNGDGFGPLAAASPFGAYAVGTVILTCDTDFSMENPENNQSCPVVPEALSTVHSDKSSSVVLSSLHSSEMSDAWYVMVNGRERAMEEGRVYSRSGSRDVDVFMSNSSSDDSSVSCESGGIEFA